MRLISDIRRRVERVLTAPGEELGRWALFLRYQFKLWWFCIRRLREHNAGTMGAALSFRTIFALVPTIILAFLVLRAVGQIETGDALHRLLETAGLTEITIVEDGPATTRPTTGPAGQTDAANEVSLAARLERLVGRVESQLTLGRVGPIGVLILIYTAVTLMATVEKSLNRIFQAPKARGFVRRVLLYWSVLTLVPLLLLSASFLFGQLVSATSEYPLLAWIARSLRWVESRIVGLLLLAAVYMYMPNTRVSFREAIGGALIALILWALLKWSFTGYVGLIVRNRSLYGALGLIPLFLFWLNLIWLIFLFGAELAHTAAHLSRMQSAEEAEKIELSPWDSLAAAVVVARRYESGGGWTETAEVAEALNLPGPAVERLIGKLKTADVVCPVESGGTKRSSAYVLARPAERIGVLEIVETDRGAGGGRPGCDQEVAARLEAVRGRVGEALEETTLADVAGHDDQHDLGRLTDRNA